jgi:tight adherence protein B
MMMFAAVAASLGIAAIGVLLTIVGEDALTWSGQRRLDKKVVLRWAVPALVALTAWWLSQWVVIGAIAGAASGWVMFRASGRRPVRDERVFVDALATWVEQLRDTLAGAHGLEEAIRVTASRAPRVMLDEVQRLVSHMAYGSTATGLRRFADDLHHPTADFVVSALLTATQYQARDLTVLLTHVAECARDEGRMRSRVWVSRARTRSSVRIIAGVVVSFVAGLFVLSADYLAPYGTVGGQVILLGICSTFVFALVLMQRLSALAMPERFVRRREAS